MCRNGMSQRSKLKPGWLAIRLRSRPREVYRALSNGCPGRFRPLKPRAHNVLFSRQLDGPRRARQGPARQAIRPEETHAQFNLVAPVPPPHFIVANDPASPPEGLRWSGRRDRQFRWRSRGHLGVIKRAKALAHGLAGLAWSSPSSRIRAISSKAQHDLPPHASPTKAVALERLGIDGMIVIPFDKALASLTRRFFITEILLAPPRHPRRGRWL